MSGILDIDGMTQAEKSRRKAKDAKGRLLSHNATVEDVYDIVQDECAKVHEHYLSQIPRFVATMIQDALLSYGLVVPTDEAKGASIATAEAPVVSENAGGGTPPADSTEPVDTGANPT